MISESPAPFERYCKLFSLSWFLPSRNTIGLKRHEDGDCMPGPEEYRKCSSEQLPRTRAPRVLRCSSQDIPSGPFTDLCLCRVSLCPRCRICHLFLLSLISLVIAQSADLSQSLCKASYPSRQTPAPPRWVSSVKLLMLLPYHWCSSFPAHLLMSSLHWRGLGTAKVYSQCLKCSLADGHEVWYLMAIMGLASPSSVVSKCLWLQLHAHSLKYF